MKDLISISKYNTAMKIGSTIEPDINKTNGLLNYENNLKRKFDFIPIIFMVVVIIILLIIYKRFRRNGIINN